MTRCGQRAIATACCWRLANQRIAEALGTPDAEEDPGDEDDGDLEQAS